MRQKTLVLITILILVMLSAIQINAQDISNTNLEDPIPEICCSGAITYVEIDPGSEVKGSFEIYNCGDEGSLLQWEIKETPIWADFVLIPPINEIGLSTHGVDIVDVIISVPLDQEKTFHGEIIIVNSDNKDDTCSINVNIDTPKIKYIQYNHLIQTLFEIFPFLNSILNTLRNL